jgi:hypothetical protein
MEKTKEETEREEGIQAIIDLQAFIGITELREKAEKSWDKFSVGQKKQTIKTHEICCKKKN